MGRAIVGVSAGGYGATILGLHHLGTFAVDRVVVGVLPPDRSERARSRCRAEPQRTPHTLIGDLRASQKRQPTFFAFYVGRGDNRFRAENVQFDRELTSAHVPHVFDGVPRCAHDELWTAHAAAWLAPRARPSRAPDGVTLA